MTKPRRVLYCLAGRDEADLAEREERDEARARESCHFLSHSSCLTGSRATYSG